MVSTTPVPLFTPFINSPAAQRTWMRHLNPFGAIRFSLPGLSILPSSHQTNREGTVSVHQGDRRLEEARAHKRGMKPLPKRLAHPGHSLSTQALHWALSSAVDLCRYRLAKGPWQQSIQSHSRGTLYQMHLPPPPTLGAQLFLLIFLFTPFLWLGQTELALKQASSASPRLSHPSLSFISCQSEKARKWTLFVGLINSRSWSAA